MGTHPALLILPFVLVSTESSLDCITRQGKRDNILNVRIEAPDGKPIPRQFDVAIIRIEDGKRRVVKRGGTEKGSVRFDGLPVDEELVVKASCYFETEEVFDDTSESKNVSLGEGADTTIRFVFGRVYRGRAVDKAGKPLANVNLGIQLTCFPHPDSPGRDLTCRTDSAGRFRYFDLGRQEFAHMGNDLVLATLEGDQEPYRIGVQAALSLAETECGQAMPPSKTVFELGDVKFLGKTTLIAGTVVDQHGKPIPGVNIRAFFRRTNSEGFWCASSPTTGGDGTFEILDPRRYGELNIEIMEPSWAFGIQRGPFPAGSKNLRIEMRRNGGTKKPHQTVRGTLKVDPATRGLSVWFIDEQGDKSRARIDDQSGFRDWLPAGKYRVEVHGVSLTHLEEFPAPLRRIDDVRVLPTSRNVDPRLQPIDCRGATRNLRLRLEGPPSLKPRTDQSKQAPTCYADYGSVSYGLPDGCAQPDRKIDGAWNIQVPANACSFWVFRGAWAHVEWSEELQEVSIQPVREAAFHLPWVEKKLPFGAYIELHVVPVLPNLAGYPASRLMGSIGWGVSRWGPGAYLRERTCFVPVSTIYELRCEVKLRRGAMERIPVPVDLGPNPLIYIDEHGHRWGADWEAAEGRVEKALRDALR